MSRSYRLLSTLLTMVFAASLGTQVNASEPFLRDDAGLFSPAARQEAEQSLARLKADRKMVVQIETMAELPAAAKPRTGENDTSALSRFAKERITELKGQGLYVLISKSPPRVHALRDRQLNQRGFHAEDEQAVVQALIGGLKAKQADNGLAQTLRVIDERIVAAAARPATSQTAAPIKGAGNAGGWNMSNLLLMGLLVFGVLMLVSMVMRALSGGGSPAYGGMGMGGGGWGGGGGFFSGLAGALAGSYLYDSFFRGDHGSSWTDGSSAGMTGGESMSDTGAGDFSGGSSWSDGSAGDWGGGGGDMGGGGDFGGSGGDW